MEKSIIKLKKIIMLITLAGLCLQGFALEKGGKTLEERRQDVFITAMIQEKKMPECRKFLRKVFAATDKDNVMRLMELAAYAKQADDAHLMARLYKEIIKKRPNDLKVKRELAFACLWIEEYPMAAKYFAEYNKITGGDFLTNYNQGEIMYLYPALFRFKTEKTPSDYFKKALKQSYSLAKQSKEKQSIEAKALFRLGRYSESFKVFDKLETQYPDDIDILLDYTNFLMSGGYSELAYEKLSVLPEDILNDASALDRYKIPPEKRKDVILNICLTRIAYYTGQKEFFKLKSKFSELEQRYPDSAALAVAKAEYYQSFENWRGQLQSTQHAFSLNNSNRLRDIAQRITHNFGSALRVESGIRLSDNNGFEFINQVRAEFRLNDTFKIGAHYMVDYASLHEVPRSNGQIEDFSGVRNWLELYAQADFINGDMARISYYNHSGFSGVGAEYTMLDFWGNTRLKGAFCAPYWGRQQSIAQRGTINYIELKRVYHPFESLSLSGLASLNSYNLGDSLDLAKSVAFQAEVSYVIPETDIQRYVVGANARFSLNYTFDGEFFGSYKENYNPQGEKYRIADYQDINVHTVFVGFAKEFNQDFKTEAFAGYAINVSGRTADHGAVYGLSFSYMITKQLELGGRLNHTVSTNLYFYAGMDLKYSFSPNTVADYINMFRKNVRN